MQPLKFIDSDPGDLTCVLWGLADQPPTMQAVNDVMRAVAALNKARRALAIEGFQVRIEVA